MSKRIGSIFVLVFLIAGCGHKDAPESSEKGFQQALAYARCMRANGVPNFPDPKQDGNQVQVDVSKDVDLNAPATKKALEACRDKLPQGAGGGPDGGSVDPAKLADWMNCMRAKLPNLPDAEVGGGAITIKLQGTGINADSPEFENARRDCESHFPGGSLNVVGRQ